MTELTVADLIRAGIPEADVVGWNVRARDPYFPLGVCRGKVVGFDKGVEVEWDEDFWPEVFAADDCTLTDQDEGRRVVADAEANAEYDRREREAAQERWGIGA